MAARRGALALWACLVAVAALAPPGARGLGEHWAGLNTRDTHARAVSLAKVRRGGSGTAGLRAGEEGRGGAGRGGAPGEVSRSWGPGCAGQPGGRLRGLGGAHAAELHRQRRGAGQPGTAFRPMPAWAVFVPDGLEQRCASLAGGAVQEYQRRFAVWLDNVDFVHHHNTQRNSSFWVRGPGL